MMHRMLRIFLLFLTSLWLLCGDAPASPSAKHEVSPMIVFYNGDALRTMTLGGLQYTYKFNRTWWLGSNTFIGRAKLDRNSPLVEVEDGDFLLQADAGVYLNLPALLGASRENKDNGIRSDLYTVLALGYVQAGDAREWVGIIGGGMVIHFNKPSWLALRFDLRSMFLKLENTQGSDFNSDLSLGIGPSFTF